MNTHPSIKVNPSLYPSIHRALTSYPLAAGPIWCWDRLNGGNGLHRSTAGRYRQRGFGHKRLVLL